MSEQSPPVGRTLWELPVGAVAVVLTVEAAALGLLAATAAVPSPGPLVLGGFLALLGVAHIEVATGIERIRRRASQTSYVDFSSVWTFAAALLLPPTVTAAVVLVVYAHLWHRVWRPARVPLHRHVYTAATVLFAACAAHAVVTWSGGLPGRADDLVGVSGVVLAVVLYVVVGPLLVAVAIRLSGERAELRDLVGRWDDNALKVATICLGALAALALGSTPGLVALVLPPILVLHRAVLVRQLEEVASTDGKTGLLTAAAWQAEAVRTVQRGSGAAGVLILDLDHFKAVNDAYGHLAGDDVLAAVAAQLRTGVRAQDVVGRFGGEEFVVLLPDLPPGPDGRTQLRSVAERLRERIARLDVPIGTTDGVLVVTGLTVSIGGATVPADGTDLDHVLAAADASLYVAKRAGRNLVRLAGPVRIPTPRGRTAVAAPSRSGTAEPVRTSTAVAERTAGVATST